MLSRMKKTFAGGCHCGAVRFEVRLDTGMAAHACNCSICSKLAYVHLIAPKRDFKLLKGKDALGEYTFNTGIAKHMFCKTCGVKSFYRPRSNPNCWSVNLRCLDTPDALDAQVLPFDGAHWDTVAGTSEPSDPRPTPAS
jgi:hypothetical protein